MKVSYDEEKRDKKEMVLLEEEIDVDKFLMELEEDELIEFNLDTRVGGVDDTSFNKEVMDKIDNYYPEILDVQVVQDIQEEIYDRGKGRLMLVYLCLVLLSMILFSTGIFTDICEVFVNGNIKF